MSFQCVFVNTEQPPLHVKRLGCFKYISGRKPNEFEFQELCEFTYSHPDAPDDAVVSVYRWVELEITPGTEPLLKQAIEASNAIDKITRLKDY